jgi:hypothetical protein
MLVLNAIFNYFVAVCCFGGGNRRTQRKTLTLRKLLTTITTMCYFIACIVTEHRSSIPYHLEAS